MMFPGRRITSITIRRLLAVGILASAAGLAGAGVALVAASDSPRPRTPAEKQAVIDRVETQRQAQLASQPRVPVDPVRAARLRSEPPGGLSDRSQIQQAGILPSMLPPTPLARNFVVLNVWNDPASGREVFAGGYSGDPMRGAIWLERYSAGMIRPTSLTEFDAPASLGWLSITGVGGDIVRMQSHSSQAVTFDLSTLRFS